MMRHEARIDSAVSHGRKSSPRNKYGTNERAHFHLSTPALSPSTREREPELPAIATIAPTGKLPRRVRMLHWLWRRACFLDRRNHESHPTARAGKVWAD